MLNKTGITKVSATTVDQILLNTELQYSVGVVVNNSSAVAGADGRKVIKAGTPMVGDLDARATAMTPAKGSSGETVVGVLLHDVDITGGAANGTLLIFGFVNTNRIDSTTKSLITSTVKSALPMIKFISA